MYVLAQCSRAHVPMCVCVCDSSDSAVAGALFLSNWLTGFW